MEFKFDPIEDILEEIRQGHIVIMQDAESRENEGDYICAAEFSTPENVNTWRPKRRVSSACRCPRRSQNLCTWDR